MKRSIKLPKFLTNTRAGLTGKLRDVMVLSMCTLLLVSPELQAARPGGVAVLLPPFIPTLPPTPFLQPVSPFAITGFIQAATLNATAQPGSGCVAGPSSVCLGGTLVVNGITITIPDNTILQTPAVTMTWQELFTGAPAPYGPTQTGLALADIPKPLATYEISVQGNRVIGSTSDQYIAGLVFISQQSLNTSQGYINAITWNPVDGEPEMLVSKTLGATTGAIVRINSAGGRYTTPDPLGDPRFSADEDNPTISARNGFPMCLPRTNPATANDFYCPQWNRPRDQYTGAYATNFTMQNAGSGVLGPDGNYHQTAWGGPGTPYNPPVKPDPYEQMPFEVGDYITYAGTLTAYPSSSYCGGQTGTACQFISAHTVIAELAAFTAPGTWPVYTRIDEFRILLGGTPNPIFPQEDQEKIFGDGFTTDWSQLVDIFGVDVDPCKPGVDGGPLRSHRFYMTADPFGPPLGGLQGRARFRATIGSFLPGTREMAAVSRSLTNGAPIDAFTAAQPGGVLKTVANGLAAGVYHAPQFEFIFPENLIIGSQQIPLTFEQLPFLVNGTGGYLPFDGSPSVKVGPITPFPSTSQPTASCTTNMLMIQPPVSNAGSPQTVASGSTVTLDGSNSSDPNGYKLIYTWIQTGGPVVAITGANQSKPTFTAPVLPPGSTPATLSFQMAVCNGFTCGGISSVNVTVMPSPGAPNITLSVDNAHPIPGSVVNLTETTTSGGVAPMTTVFTQTAGPAVPLTVTGANTRSFVATVPAGTPLPATLTFQATVTDSATPVANKSTASVSVFVGADTIAVTNVVYALSKSRLQVAMTDNALPKGAATITVTPLVNGVPIAAGIVATYDPGVDGYNILAAIVNPIPDSVRIVSNYGFVGTFPVTKIR